MKLSRVETVPPGKGRAVAVVVTSDGPLDAGNVEEVISTLMATFGYRTCHAGTIAPVQCELFSNLSIKEAAAIKASAP